MSLREGNDDASSLIWPMAQLGSPFTDGASQMRGYKRKPNVQTWRNWAFITLQLDGLLLQYSMKDKRDRLFLFPLFLSPRFSERNAKMEASLNVINGPAGHALYRNEVCARPS